MMSEQNQTSLGFPENLDEGGIDVNAIFGTDAPVDGDPFAEPQQPSTPVQQAIPAAQEPPDDSPCGDRPSCGRGTPCFDRAD